MLCKLASVSSSLDLRAAGPHSSRCPWRSWGLIGPENTLHGRWGYVSAPQPGQEGWGRSGLSSIAQTGSLVGRGQELPAALDRNESPASAPRGEAPCLLLALLWVIRSSCLPLSLSTASHTASGSRCQPSLSEGGGRHSHSRWGPDSAPCLGMSKLGSGVSKTPGLGI